MNTMVKFSLCTLSDEELVKKVDKLTDEMFQKQEIPTRNIPAEPDNDYDLLVGELLIRFSNQVQAVVKPEIAEAYNKGKEDAVTEIIKQLEAYIKTGNIDFISVSLGWVEKRLRKALKQFSV